MRKPFVDATRAEPRDNPGLNLGSNPGYTQGSKPWVVVVWTQGGGAEPRFEPGLNLGGPASSWIQLGCKGNSWNLFGS